MDNRSDIIDKLSFLSRAESRIRVLETLSTTEPTTQRELRDSIPLARSTIVRAVDSLTEFGWATKAPDGVRLTPVGAVVIEEFLGAVESVAAAEELTPFLEWFPLSEFDIDIEDLQGGTVTVTTEGDPLAPVRQHTKRLRTATEFRAVLPSIGIEPIKGIHERTLTGDLESEFVVPPGVETTIRIEEFAPLFEEMLATGRLTIHITDSASFFLGLVDEETTQIGVEGDDGLPRALLETSNERVRSWGNTFFTDSRRAAIDRLTEL
jgi:predicted transcriptional regulator